MKSRNVLAIDIGGTHVKVLVTGQKQRREFESGPELTPGKMAAGVRKLTRDWKYDAVSIGYPGPVLHGRPVAEPHNLARGWVAFNYQAAFKRPVKIINDAAMQALGCYRRGKMLFLGLGTGLGTALIVDGKVEPMELGHLPYRKGTYEDYVGLRGLKRYGKKKWRKHVADVVARLIAALRPDDVVLGGGNVTKLKRLPRGCREGDNDFAFKGGFRLWAEADEGPRRSTPRRQRSRSVVRRARRKTISRRKSPIKSAPKAAPPAKRIVARLVKRTSKLEKTPVPVEPASASPAPVTAVIESTPPQQQPGPAA